MIETSIVREKYASMPDRELIFFAKTEGHQLTREGLDLLNAELLRRQLTAGMIENPETGKNVTAESNDSLIGPGLAYIYDQKENGKSNATVIAGLLELGMEEQAAEQFLLKTEITAKQRLKKAEGDLLIGMAVLSSGIAITFLPLSMPANRLTYIVAWCAILFGALKFVKGVYNKSRFKKIIKNLVAENDLQS